MVLHVLSDGDGKILDDRWFEPTQNGWMSQKGYEKFFNFKVFFPWGTQQSKAFPHEDVIVDLILFGFIKSLNHVVDKLNLVLIYSFISFKGFAENWPENIEQIRLEDSISHAESRDALFEKVSDHDEEINNIFMGAGMPVGLFWKVRQEADDKLIGDFEKLGYVRFGWVPEQPHGDTVDEAIEVLHGVGVNSIPLETLESRGYDVHLP